MRAADRPAFLQGDIAFSAASITAYRNIYTCFPSQDLYDDLVAPEDFAVLQAAEALASGIDHALPPKHRVFQYGASTSLEAAVTPASWGGRFSDHTFGVWYAAADAKTAIAETLYHWMQRVAPDRANTRDRIASDRKMFRAELVSAAAVDLLPLAAANPWLTEADYTRCRQAGRWFRASDAGFLQTPSARRRGGICTPAFDVAAVRQEKPLYFLRYELSPGSATPIVLRADV